MPPERRNNDIQIARLEEQIKALDAKIDDRFNSLIKEMRDIKENIIPRLERVEITKLVASEFVNFKVETVGKIENLQTDLDKVSLKIAYATGAVAVITSIFWFLIDKYLK